MGHRFSNRDLKKLIIPLFLEQLLVMLVGIADTFMVSFAGDTAVSGVSLVNMFVVFFIYVFSALASGGAVVVSQYLGRNEKDNADHSAGQLLTVSVLVLAACTILILLFNRPVLKLLFGRVEDEVMTACVVIRLVLIHNIFSATAWPFGGALPNGLRAAGDVKFTMIVAVASTAFVRLLLSVVFGIWMNMGVIGIAWAMVFDWIVRGILFVIRYKQGKWKSMKVV